MEIFDLIKSRHSVRQYLDNPIEEEKKSELENLIKQCNEESNLNIQIIYNDPKCFKTFLSRLAHFKNANNYISIIVNLSDENAYVNAGYYGEKIVLKAQELGLNTCWVGGTHGKIAAKINENEKNVIVISIGYGENQGHERKSKKIEHVSNIVENMPDWYKKGVEAALLAPTAINRQKFFFELIDNQVTLKVGKGSFTKLDAGIVKYHFEEVSGHKINQIIY